MGLALKVLTKWETLDKNRLTYLLRFYHSGTFIYYVCTIFRKTNISYPQIRLRLCAYQGVRNVSFPGKFYEFNKWLIHSTRFRLILFSMFNPTKSLLFSMTYVKMKSQLHQPRDIKPYFQHEFCIFFFVVVLFLWGCFVVLRETFQAKPMFRLIRVQFVENFLQHQLWKKRKGYNHIKQNFKLIFFSFKRLADLKSWVVIIVCQQKY